MNLLLLLSALLSALTGVGGQARVSQVAVAVRVAPVRAVEQAASVAGLRPANALPAMIDVAAAPLAMVRSLATREPLFAGRRRE